MGHRYPVLPRVQHLHHLLLKQGIQPGQRIPRPAWDQAIAQTYQVAAAQSRNLTKAGEEAGLWRRIPGLQAKPGSIELLGLPEADA